MEPCARPAHNAARLVLAANDVVVGRGSWVVGSAEPLPLRFLGARLIVSVVIGLVLGQEVVGTFSIESLAQPRLLDQVG